MVFYYVREILEEGIKHGGTSISDYRHADGKTGEMQLHLNVYKQPVCKVCGSQIEQKSSRQEIVIIVQYVKNKERVKLCRKLLGQAGGIASGKSTVSETLIRIRF